MAVITGTASGDNLTGNAGEDDIFRLYQGGSDTASGLSGNDTFMMRNALNAGDMLDGGDGTDTVLLKGATSVTMNATTMTNIETLLLKGNFFYSLVTDDGNVAAGQHLIVNAGHVGNAGPPARGGEGGVPVAGLFFNGSAETNGTFSIRGSHVNDIITGGGLNDDINLRKGGADTANGGGGNDFFKMGKAFDASDTIDGGAGSNDTLSLDGNYAGGNAVVFGATTMTNVEIIALTAGTSYTLTTNDANVGVTTLTVDGSTLGAGDVLTFDASADTDSGFDITGGAGDDVLIGGGVVNRFDLSHGGDDTAYGVDAIGFFLTDTFSMGAAFTAADTLDGGGGFDSVTLSGDYTGANAVVFGAATMTNVEVVVVTATLADQSYDLTTDDATVAAGQSLGVSALSFGAFTATLTFDGSAETNGKFDLSGDDGDDDLTGGAGNDQFFVGTGNDTAVGGAGNDSFYFAADLTASDTIDGGADADNLALGGDYTGANAVVFGATTMVNVESIGLSSGGSYDLTTDNATVAAGQQLNVNGFLLAATESLTFDGSAETDGKFRVDAGLADDTAIGGAGNDTFILRGGSDTATGGGGADAFTYFSGTESTSTTHDTITDFNANADTFDLVAFVGGFDGTIDWSVDSADFDNDIGNAFSDGLTSHANHAWVVHASGGTLAGHDYLVVDTNSDANYDAGTDYVFDITGYTGTLDGSDFI